MINASVVLPTHNRPQYLREALTSVVEQTYSSIQVVIVDDGSEPAVDLHALRDEFKLEMKLVRNDSPKKLTVARYQGVQAAEGNVVIHLDDDDRLAPVAVEKAVSALHQHELEIVFLKAKGFGARAAYFDEAQEAGTSKVVMGARGVKVSSSLVLFGDALFPALLKAVPMSFQRVACSRDTWLGVSNQRLEVYWRVDGLQSRAHALERIVPPWRDSEWSLYAAAARRAGLIEEPVYLQRCEGQGYQSIGVTTSRVPDARVDILSHLLVGCRYLKVLHPFKSAIRRAAAASHFGRAHFHFYQGSRLEAYRSLFRTLATYPQLRYSRFGMRMLLPRKLPWHSPRTTIE